MKIMKRIMKIVFHSNNATVIIIAASVVIAFNSGQCSEAPDYPFLAKRETRWDTLSKKIAPQIIERNADIGMMMRYIEKAECTIAVTSISKLAGKQNADSISYSLEDKNKDGILSYGEITSTPRIGGMTSFALSKIANDFKDQIYLNVFNLFSVTDVFAKKIDDGYLMKLIFTEKMSLVNSGINDCQIKVSDDYRIVEWRTKIPLQNDTVKRKLSHKKMKEKWLLAGMSLSTPLPDGNIIKEEWKYNYSLDGDIPLLFSIELKTIYPTTAGGSEITTLLEFKNWKTKKREIPLPIVAKDKPESEEDKEWESEDDEMKSIEELEEEEDEESWAGED